MPCRSNLAPLHGFTERFTPRFIELPHDRHVGVAIAGLDFLAALVEAEQVPADKVADVYW